MPSRRALISLVAFAMLAGVSATAAQDKSIVVASTATRWYGHEGDILRYVFFHSIVLAMLVGGLVMLQAYVYPFTLLQIWPG